MNIQPDCEPNESQNTDEVVKALLEQAVIDSPNLTFDRRKELISELKKRDRPLLASSKAHGP